jgi:modulator of FtsH protease HflK
MLRLRYILIIAFCAYLLTGLARVRPEERAVVRRFGEVVARPGPGLWIGLPWGIDRVDRVPVRTVRQISIGFSPEAGADTVETPSGQFLTGDQNLVNVQLVLDYAIDEADRDLDDFIMHREMVDGVLAREAEAATAAWVAGRPVDEVLLTGNAALPAWVMERLPSQLAPYRLGVRVQRVSVAILAPPDEVRGAFEAVTQAQTGIRTKEYQARQEADLLARQAAAVRYKLEQEAEEYCESRLKQARADATEFNADLSAYRQLKATNPEALTFIWWDEMKKTLMGMKARGGRVEPLDAYLGPDGLDVTQFLTPRKQ